MKKTILTIFLVVLSLSCRKIVQLPPEPSIDFSSFEVFDTTDILGNDLKGGRLKFYFEDGDGDLGLKAPDLAYQAGDTTNLFFTLLRKNNGIYIEADESDPLKPSDYRIPYMSREGQNKILKGTISVTFMYLFYEPTDTIKYEFFIKDRAKNISNTVTTCEIALNLNGLCSD